MINFQGRDERDGLEAVLHGRWLGPLLSGVAVQFHHASAFFPDLRQAAAGFWLQRELEDGLRQLSSEAFNPVTATNLPLDFLT